MQPLFHRFATIPGARHLARHLPNQDAATFRHLPEHGMLWVVADGCSAAQHPEFGARLGVHALAHAVMNTLPEFRPSDPEFWKVIREKLLRELEHARDLIGTADDAVYHYLLFTLVGALLVDETLYFFHNGDGTLWVNGKEYRLEPAEGNRPKYLSYLLLEVPVYPLEELTLQVNLALPLAEFESGIVGTDGAQDLLELKGLDFPGRTEPIPDLLGYETQQRLWGNPQALQRLLNRLNPPFRRGLLPDDTTLFLLRNAGKEWL